jgi:hypothetical protein
MRGRSVIPLLSPVSPHVPILVPRWRAAVLTPFPRRRGAGFSLIPPRGVAIGAGLQGDKGMISGVMWMTCERKSCAHPGMRGRSVIPLLSPVPRHVPTLVPRRRAAVPLPLPRGRAAGVGLIPPRGVALAAGLRGGKGAHVSRRCRVDDLGSVVMACAGLDLPRHAGAARDLAPVPSPCPFPHPDPLAESGGSQSHSSARGIRPCGAAWGQGRDDCCRVDDLAKVGLQCIGLTPGCAGGP